MNVKGRVQLFVKKDQNILYTYNYSHKHVVS